MADKKISALPAATVPLAGTEVLPIVQGGVTDQVSVANLTAGRNVAVGAAVGVPRTLSVGGSMALERYNATPTVAMRGGTDNTIGYEYRFNIVQGNGLSISNATIGGSQVEYWFFQPDGNLRLSSSNLVVGTAGKGIDFSANGGDVLTQYDEGAISIGATCDSGTITLSSNTLYYTRIGRAVHVTGALAVSSVSSPTGNVYFGLPMAAGVSSSVTLYLSDTNTLAGKIPVGLINAGQSIFYVQTLDQTTGAIGGAASIFKAGTEVKFSATYFV